MKKQFRRLGSILLTVAMLAGMLSVMGAFPAAAAPAVEKFEADFSVLPAGQVSMTDTDTVNWLESRFGFYYYQEGWYFERPKVNGYVVDADGNNLTTETSATTYLPDVVGKAAATQPKWVDGTGTGGNDGYGFSYWKVSNSPAGGHKGAGTPKYLNCTAISKDNDAFFRKANVMYVKAADGSLASLKNFQLEMDFMPANAATNGSSLKDTLDCLAVFYHANAAGNVKSTNQQVVHFDTTGNFRSAAGSAAGSYTETMTVGDSKVTLNREKEYHLSLTVVGDTMEFVLYDSRMKKLWSTERTVENQNSGFLGIGGSAAGARYGNIVVTRLDEKGNPVDFNDREPGYAFSAQFDRFLTFRNSVNTYYNSATGYTYKNNGKDTKYLERVTTPAAFDDTWYISKGLSVKEYLENKFTFYFSREGNQFTMATPYQTSEELKPEEYKPAINGGACAQWKADKDGWLTATYVWAGNELLRKTLSLAPKTTAGDFQAANFETEFDFKIGDTAKTESGVLLTFRSAEAGKVTNAGRNTSNSFADKVTLAFTPKGIGIYDNVKTSYTYSYSSYQSGGMLDASGNPTAAFSFWNGNATVSKAHVYVKVVGDTMRLRVTDTAGTVLAEKQVTLNREGSGYLYYTSCNYDTGFANIRLNRLDADGDVAAFDPPSSFSLTTTAANGDITADSETETYLKSKVDAYYDNDGTLVSAPFVSTSNVGTFSYTYDKLFQGQIPSAHRSTATHLKAVATMVPKTDDGNAAVLKNFEMTFKTRWAEGAWNGYPNASVVIGGRQQTAGKFTTAAGNVVSEQGVIVISSTGITIAAGNDLTDAVYSSADAKTFDTALSPSGNWNNYTVTVRVVGKKVTVTIGDKTYNGIWNYDKAGYLAFGISGRSMQVGDVTLTRLDDKGNAVEWNDSAEQIIPTTWAFDATGLTAYKSATTVAQRTQYLDAFNGAFDVYYNDFNAGDYDYHRNASVVGNTVGYNYAYLTSYPTGYLWGELNYTPTGYGDDDMQRPQTEMRQIGSLVPKDIDGDLLFLKNFEMKGSLMHHMANSAYGAHVIGFRMAAPGKYLADDGSAASGSYILFTTDNVKVYENGTLIHEKAFSKRRLDSCWSYTVRVVGNTLTYTFRQLFTGNEVVTGTVTLSAGQEGYLGFGQTTRRHFYGMTNMSVTALDAAGNPTPLKQPAKPYGNGDVTATERISGENIISTITVTPDEGYQLRAGSLVATDENGNRYVPMRVGFRQEGNASQYAVTAPSSVTMSAAFYRPTREDPNIGNIGVSTNSEKHGLRLISRFTRTKDEEGKEYLLLDGENCEIADYGMLIAVESVIGSEAPTVELAEANAYVSQVSVKKANVYFDLCDDYVDMSVCIVNIDRLNALGAKIVGRAYVKLADGSVLYADSFGTSYEKASGMKTTSLSELNATSKLLKYGRADVVSDAYQMDWVNTGFEIKGNIVDSVKLKTTSTREDSLLNVSVDGKAPTVVHVPQGDATVTLASGLTDGEHSVKVISGTSVRFGTLTAKELQYTGSLETVKQDNTRLKIEVLGDSITCGWGMDGVSGGSYTTVEQIGISNAYDSYAAITARNLDADLNVVALCSQTIPAVHGFFPNLNKRTGSPAWNFAKNQANVVIVNLGTNDEWQGTGLNNANFTAEKSLENMRSLLSDVRSAYPDAYIIWVYGMMRKTYEAQYQQAITEMNDPKAMFVDMTAYKSTGGYDGNHPKRDSHAQVAEALTAFIRENCSEMFGHTTHTATIADLESANTVRLNGRTTASGTARQMRYGSTGITLSGYLYGDMTMNVALSDYACALNVVIDGDTENVQTVWLDAGNTAVPIYTDLNRGYHTVEITRGTSNFGTLTMQNITYTGTLQTPVENPLQMEVLGDSITAGEGMFGPCDGSALALSRSHNSFLGYAAQTARNIGADVTLVAVSGNTTAQIRNRFNDAAWNTAANQKDIVVINLGTNDFGWSTKPEASTIDGLADTCLGLIADVRAAYPDAYIIWAYGMMFDKDKEFLSDTIIPGYVAEHSDDKVLFCDLSAAKNNDGHGGHPSVAGNTAAAGILTAFIEANCADILG